jgi:hypothetical protein
MVDISLRMIMQYCPGCGSIEKNDENYAIIREFLSKLEQNLPLPPDYDYENWSNDEADDGLTFKLFFSNNDDTPAKVFILLLQIELICRSKNFMKNYEVNPILVRFQNNELKTNFLNFKKFLKQVGYYFFSLIFYDENRNCRLVGNILYV